MKIRAYNGSYLNGEIFQTYPFPNCIGIETGHTWICFGILGMSRNVSWEKKIMSRDQLRGCVHFRFLIFGIAWKLR